MAEPTSPPARRASQQLLRLLSIDSTRSSTDPRAYEPQTVPKWNNSFGSRIFLMKIAQLIVAVICTGLYSKGLLLINHSITELMFHNIVFTSYIIITSVITLSYLLGHAMPEILVRIFNTLGAILYFISAAIMSHFLIVVGRHNADAGGKKMVYAIMLLTQVILSFLNSVLYGLDVYLSIRSTLRNLEIVEVS